MPSVILDFDRLSEQVHDLALPCESNDVERINVEEMIDVGEHLEEALAHIRSLLNTFPPINQLPPEVLAHIISYTRYDLPSLSPFPIPSDLNKWVEAMMVCRHWRRTLLNTPSLWNQIHFYEGTNGNSSERCKAWVNRSLEVLLKVFFTGSMPGTLSNSEAVKFEFDFLSSMSRLQQLHISSNWVQDSIFWRRIDQPAPHLESFSFTAQEPELDDANPNILPRIFQDDTPQLKYLSLSNVSSWPHNRFHNLIRLKLQDQPHRTRATVPEFLDFLSSSPRLEVLILVRAGPTPLGPADDCPIPPVVTLPCLQYLEIGCPGRWSSQGQLLLLRYLDIPPTATQCFYEEESRPPVARLGHHLMQSGYQGLKQIVESSRKMVLTSNSHETAHESFIGFKDSTFYYNSPRTAPSLNSTLTPMLWENIEDLVYAPSSTWCYCHLSSLLGQLPSLRKLTISGHMWYRLEEVALLLQERDLIARRGFKYAPLLEELHIYPPEQVVDEQAEESADFLMMLCNVRANNGHSLKAIVLEQFSRVSIDKLQEYFDEVRLRSERRGFSSDGTLCDYWRSYNYLESFLLG